MKTSDLNIKVLEPSHLTNWLTNGETFSQKIYLGKYDSADNWTEITSAEKERIEQEQEQERLNSLNN